MLVLENRWPVRYNTTTMPDYDLDRLGASEFEKLAQSLLISALKAPGAIIFGAGRDGAREATFSGTLDYPSSATRWSGDWIFQAKFHDINLTKPAKARSILLSDLESELKKVTTKYNHTCNNYILITNVRLSSTHLTGTHDRVAEIALRYPQVKNVHIWGGDTICRLLDSNPSVRQTYNHFLTPGDLIQSLLDQSRPHSDLAETTRLYLKYWYDRDQFAQMTQAGEPDDGPQMRLRNVFVDLELKPRGRVYWSESRGFFCMSEDSENPSTRSPKRDTPATDGSIECDPSELELSSEDTEHALSATRTLLSGRFPRAVLIAGPGYGKSTLTQHVAQWHRAQLLGCDSDLRLASTTQPHPAAPRIPFRIELKHFAQWLSEHFDSSLEAYLSLRFQEATSREVSAEQIQQIITKNPTLLLLDGLDEVMHPELRNRMITRIREFLTRTEVLGANIHTISTSRPTGYGNEFDPNSHSHFHVLALSENRARGYSTRWIEARRLPVEEQRRILDTLGHAKESPHTKALLTTPLQVTIVLVIIKDRGRPPAQREALFQRYWETILSREKSKSNEVIKSEEGLLFDLHAHLGYLLHRRAEGNATDSLLSSEDFETLVLQFLKSRDHRADDLALRQRANALLVEARNRLVLIVEPKPGLIGFELRSLQEFFAAVHMVQTARNTNERLERLKKTVLPEHWRNASLFFVGRVARNNIGEASAILELVCRPIDRTPSARNVRPGATFALEIAADGSFSVNRDLQLGALEYGVEALNTPLAFSQRWRFLGLLSGISAEDKTELLQPLLKEKFHEFKATHAWLYLHLFGFSEGIKSALERLLTSESQDEAAAALACCIQFKLPTQWLGRKIRKAKIKGVLFEEKLWSVISEDLDYGDVPFSSGTYLGQLADQIPLNDAYADTLLGRVLSFLPTEQSEPSSEPHTPLNLNTREAMFSSAWELGRKKTRSTNIGARLELTMGQLLTKSVGGGTGLSSTQAAEFDALLSTNALPSSIRKLLWWALLTKGAASGARILAFLKDIKSMEIEDYESLTYEIENQWPLLRLVGRQQIIEDHKNPLISILDPDKQIEIADRLKSLITEDDASMPPKARQRLWNALAIKHEEELSSTLPRTHAFAKSISIPTATLLDAFCHVVNNKRSRDTPGLFGMEELAYALTQLECIDAKALTRFSVISSVLEGVWPENQEFAEQAARILQRLKPECDRKEMWRSNIDPYVGLLAKHIFHKNPRTATNIESFLYALAAAQPNVPDINFIAQRAVEGEDLRQMKAIKPYLRSTNPELRYAAGLVCYYIAPGLWRFRRGTPQPKSKLPAYIGLDEDFALSMANDSSQHIFWVGACLLAQIPVTLSSPAKRVRVQKILKRLNQINTSSASEVLNGIINSIKSTDGLEKLLLNLSNDTSLAGGDLWETALRGIERMNSNAAVSKQWERSVGLGPR